jgi:hypothetical protein
MIRSIIKSGDPGVHEPLLFDVGEQFPMYPTMMYTIIDPKLVPSMKDLWNVSGPVMYSFWDPRPGE